MTILQNKKVSVIIPNYNYAKYMKKRIESVLKQTYPIYELIILDDCSSDNSDEIITKTIHNLKDKYSDIKISYVRNEKNSGKVVLQWRRGLEMACGDYIWIAEADDLSSKNFLRVAMEGFEDKDVVLSYTESKIINEKGLMLAPNFRFSRDKEKTGHFKKSYTKSGEDEIREIMAIRCTIPNVSAVVFKKTPELSLYLEQAEKYIQVGDWYLYAKLIEGKKICYNKKSMNRFRVHKGSATKRGEEHIKEIKKMHKYFCDNYALSEDIKNWMSEEEKRIIKKYSN